jgi:hypothetical protein
VGETPIPRPATFPHIRINTSNYKPAGIKEIKFEKLSEDLRKEVEQVKKTGMIYGKSYEGLNNAKLWPEKRFIQFNVISTKGKKGTCFGCGASDFLTETKMTQYPSTVGVENFANFFSYHKGKIGFCRACSISNHFALMRVMYFSDRESTFLAIPESNSISELTEFLMAIEDVYQIQNLQKILMNAERSDGPVISRTNYQQSNFVDKPQQYSGYYFLILAMLVSIKEGVREIVSKLRDDLTLQKFAKSPILKHMLQSTESNISEREYDRILYRSWLFILENGDQLVRSWRYQSTPEALELIEKLSQKISSRNLMSLVAGLTYKTGKTFVDTRREEFSKSVLYGSPSIGILERYTWDALSSEREIPYRIQELTLVLSKYVLGGNEMENDEIIKQCKSVGMKVAELAAEDGSKSLLYELRSVGNVQSLRSFIERLTFLCVLKGKVTGISNEFIDALSDGDEWNKYKSIIAIVANQRFSYMNEKRGKEVIAE